MLKKDSMAVKTAKFMIAKLKLEQKDKGLIELLTKSFQETYVAGYDLAVEECEKDDSKAGDQMHDYLTTLEEIEDVK